MKYPPVKNYGDTDAESFEAYYSRWPSTMAAIPKGIVEDWIYRHWTDFEHHWANLRPHLWRYQKVKLSNDEILLIDHVSTWIEELDAEGVEYVSGAHRSTTRLARYMLEHGTSPVPILIAKDSGHMLHPHSASETMKEPLQLIEGHRRLACLRGMIHAKHPMLASHHEVWLATIP